MIARDGHTIGISDFSTTRPLSAEEQSLVCQLGARNKFSFGPSELTALGSLWYMVDDIVECVYVVCM